MDTFSQKTKNKNKTRIFFTFLGPNPLPTLLGPHSHTPADTKPPRDEAAAGPALRSPWSARIYPAWNPDQSHKDIRKDREGGSPVPEPRRSPQETSTPRTLLPVSIRRPPNCPWRGKERGPSQSTREVYRVRPARPSRPARLTDAPRAPPPAAARAPRGTGAAARPGPPSRRGESPWGHASAGAASGTASGRRGVHGRWGRRRRGVRVTQ